MHCGLKKLAGLLIPALLYAVSAVLFIPVKVLGAPVDDFIASPAINAPWTSVFIVNLSTGDTLAAHNITKPLIPASIMKSVTIATLLGKTGPRYKYKTPVYMTGTVTDGVLNGNLLIEASGDPSVNTVFDPGSADFPEEIAFALSEKGIREIKGKIIISEKRFPGPVINAGWASGDLQHAYGTGTHGFNFEDNASGRKSVANPAAVFKSRLSAALSRYGITLENGNLPDKGKTPITEHKSSTLDEIMRSCMIRSDNQYAEAFLRTYGLECGPDGSTANGARKLLAEWKRRGAHMDSISVVDGSGLSRNNKLTARFMVDVMKSMWRDPYYASFMPLAGLQGTLKHLLPGTPLEGMLAMKTGSMNGVQCYAGYKLDEEYNPTHAVVIMMNRMADRSAARREVAGLLKALFLTGEETD